MTLVSKKKTNKRLGSFVALAVGMALNFFLPGAGTAVGAMVQATGTAATAQFAGRVVANNGDFGHALKDMRSKQMMRSLIAAAATANFGGSSAPISSLDQFVEQLPKYLAKGMGTGVISAAIQKQNIIQGMTDGALFGGASAVGNFGATNLGEAYNYGDGQIGYVQHKLSHMALGGTLGAIISKDRLKGALIGGLSAGGAEIVAEALMGDVTAQVIDLKEAGFTDDQSRDHIMKLARFNGEFSKLASAGIAAISNNNVTTALFTASNAIENNFYHTDFFRRDITFGTETIGGPLGGSPQRGNRLVQQNKGATNNGKLSSEVASNPSNSNMNALDLVGTETKLLPAPKMVRHHVFNKFWTNSPSSQKYRDFFTNHNINVDSYAIEIPATFHRSKIHLAKNDWTRKWKNWIDANPMASTKEVYQFAGRLMDEYNVSHVPLIHYKK